ncbi:hypothetical protein PTSG_12738 [Salpingoeca rosetta]|uniref:JmjC domain-containing protein n=1 Tax=Salpingoeca rosetta (strain ATCC 50818 / BSB-021) TaxID=946362 RepID=F2UJT8_SALR5|nr:uncharacterized protein PTSG_12738 [Salpingoeca rosetta]EGD77387.1 hypothetical protein PTSG_12738 [Salpingoeca rosetta]|eukprot:XP_004990731.1 hypothetical protein PTSG_12738 [Salpingoeca rosetta]
MMRRKKARGKDSKRETPATTPRQRVRGVGAVAGVAVVVVAVVLGVLWHEEGSVVKQSSGPISQEHPQAVVRGSAAAAAASGVVIVDVSAHPHRFADEVASHQEPVIVRGSNIDQWHAKHWSIAALDAHFPSIRGWYSHTDATFGPYYDSTRLLAAVVSPSNTYSTGRTFSPGCVLPSPPDTAPGTHGQSGSGQQDASDRFKYLSIETVKLDPALEDDLEPLQEAISLFPSRSSINLWLGQAGVRAHCHFDGYHNFYLQIEGRKTFYMFPPDAVAHLGVYPFLHPQHAQARANLTDPDVFASITAKHRPVVAHLAPGDVLYVPPLWWHYVVAETPSLSVNVWTETKQTGAMEGVTSETMSLLQALIPALSSVRMPAAMARHAQAAFLQRIALLISTIAAVHVECQPLVASARATAPAYLAEYQHQHHQHQHQHQQQEQEQQQQQQRDGTHVQPRSGEDTPIGGDDHAGGDEAATDHEHLAALWERCRAHVPEESAEMDAVGGAAACIALVLGHRYNNDDVLATLHASIVRRAQSNLQHLLPLQAELHEYAASILKQLTRTTTTTTARDPTDARGSSSLLAAQRVCAAVLKLPASTRPLWLGNWIETLLAALTYTDTNQHRNHHQTQHHHHANLLLASLLLSAP